MDNNFKAYSSYYDLLYADKDYSAEAAYILNLIDTYTPNAKTILEYGSGTGNHAAYLCNRGLEVTGLERSADMVALAKQKNIQGFHPTVEDIIDYNLDKNFDFVTALFHVISYLTDNADLIKCFELANKHLSDSGYFAFDVWYGPCVYNERPETRIKRLAKNNIEITRLAEPVWHYNRNVIDVNYEIIVKDTITNRSECFRETHPMRYFSIPEIEILANSTGFELVKAEEFLTGNTPGINTWGVCFILKKVKNVTIGTR